MTIPKLRYFTNPLPGNFHICTQRTIGYFMTGTNRKRWRVTSPSCFRSDSF